MTALTLPAHSLLTGDRVNLWGTWHLVGTVTVENQLPEGAIVHVVLDHGTTDADLDAHDEFEVARPATHTQLADGSIGVNLENLYALFAGGLSVADARALCAAAINACDDADAANGNPIGLLPGIPDTLDELLGGAL